MADFEIIDIQENARTGGWWCHFQVGERFYLADLSDVMGSPEAMIFEADKNGDVLSWGELDVDYPQEVSPNALMTFVARFASREAGETSENPGVFYLYEG